MIRRAGALVLGILLFGSAATAAEQPPLNWAAWEHLPVLQDGRIKPLDSLARAIVRGVCGQESPRLGLPAEIYEKNDSAWAPARELFPEKGTRKFTPSELLFSWLVEPERWERVPFLFAGNEDLRKDGLGLSARDAEGNHLKFVSPYEVSQSGKFEQKLAEIRQKYQEARRDRQKFEPVGLEKEIQRLYSAFASFRAVSSTPRTSGAAQERFMGAMQQIISLWNEMAEGLRNVPVAGKDEPDYAAKANEAMQQIREPFMGAAHGKGGEDVDLGKIEQGPVALRESAAGLARQIEAFNQRLVKEAGQEARGQQARISMRAKASLAAELARLANEAHLGLYDSGESISVVPALNAAALDRNRDPRAETQPQPWLNLQAVLFGSDLLLRDYPQRELGEVRSSFTDAAKSYRDRQNPQRQEKFEAALGRLALSTRALGTAIEPLRQALPIRERDEELIAATAYPARGATDLEVTYNRIDPFMWTWVLSLAAVCSFLVTAVLRRTMFCLGMGLLVAGQAFTIAGLAMRVLITGRAPVTTMFETIIFVALVVSLLGLWFAFLPLFSRALQIAWRLTGIPGTLEASSPAEMGLSMSDGAWKALNGLVAGVRFGLAVAVIYLLSMVSYGHGADETAISLWPRMAIDASMPTMSDLLVWIVGLSMLGLSVYFLPRFIPTAVLGLLLTPSTLRSQGVRKQFEQVIVRKPFAPAGAAVACSAAYIACNATIFATGKDISPLMPVLRNNFWLTSHVLTITASYGAGALAWGLGNLALGYYLFGRYRDPETHPASIPVEEHRPAGDQVVAENLATRRPPEACSVLSAYNYKATQVAVVLLIAGTILGALWADVSWGRFWGWDSKEVWALISSLVYLAILHGRYAGLFGNFGLAVGSVFGATSILMAWYGVNFVLGTGLHKYGDGAGGLGYVVSALIANWLFVLAAWVRYQLETGGRK